MKSADLMKEVKAVGWVLKRVKGSHHTFKHPNYRYPLTIPHPKKDLKKGWLHKSGRMQGCKALTPAQSRVPGSTMMLYPVAIEVGNEDYAFGVVVPDLKGCFSAGDSYEEALANVVDAIEGHLEIMAEDGDLPPQASNMTDLVSNPDYQGWVWALVDVNVEPFLGKSAKINVTLPTLITRKIDDTVNSHPEYASRSHFLQVAAMNELRGNVG